MNPKAELRKTDSDILDHSRNGKAPSYKQRKTASSEIGSAIRKQNSHTVFLRL